MASAYLFRSTELLAGRPAVLGNPADATPLRRGRRTGAPRPGWPSTSLPPDGSSPTLRPPMPWPSSSASPPTSCASGWGAAGLAGARDGYRIGTGFVGHPSDRRRPHQHRPPAAGRTDAAADRMPLLAVPDHHGRDHHLGTLGLHAGGRLDQPRRDDHLQPLRPRRDRRLAAPRGCRPRPCRAGLQEAGDRPPTAAGTGLGQYRHETPYGAAEVEWRHEGQIAVRAIVPANTTAVVRLPGTAAFTVAAGSHEWMVADRASTGSRRGDHARPHLPRSWTTRRPTRR